MQKIITIAAFFIWVPVWIPVAHAQPTTERPVQEAELSVEDCLKAQQAIDNEKARNSANVTPGVDVRGKPVVGADLTSGEIAKPPMIKKIIIDFGIDLGQRYNLSAGAYTATAGIATITYNMQSGAMELDGKPLKRAEARAVRAACQMQGHMQGE